MSTQENSTHFPFLHSHLTRTWDIQQTVLWANKTTEKDNQKNDPRFLNRRLRITTKRSILLIYLIASKVQAQKAWEKEKTLKKREIHENGPEKSRTTKKSQKGSPTEKQIKITRKAL